MIVINVRVTTIDYQLSWQPSFCYTWRSRWWAGHEERQLGRTGNWSKPKLWPRLWSSPGAVDDDNNGDGDKSDFGEDDANWCRPQLSHPQCSRPPLKALPRTISPEIKTMSEEWKIFHTIFIFHFYLIFDSPEINASMIMLRKWTNLRISISPDNSTLRCPSCPANKFFI